MVYTIKQKTWASFKQIVTQRNLYIYEIRNCATYYVLVANDGCIIIECVISKIDLTSITDYENNYRSDITKACANTDFS